MSKLLRFCTIVMLLMLATIIDVRIGNAQIKLSDKDSIIAKISTSKGLVSENIKEGNIKNLVTDFEAIQISSGSGNPQNVKIAADNQYVYFVWEIDDHEIYWVKTDYNGNPLYSEVNVSNTTGFSTKPAISIDSAGNSYVVWQEGSGWGDVYFNRIDADGNLLLSNVYISGNVSSDPEIATKSNGESHIIWDSREPAIRKLKYNRYDTLGNYICGSDITISSDILDTEKQAQIAGGDVGDSYCIWRDNYNFGYYIYFGGINATCGVNFVNRWYSNNNAHYPDICIGGGFAWLIFELNGRLYNLLGNNNVCAVTSSGGNAHNPANASDGTGQYVAWHDNRDGNWEIYYAKIYGCNNLTGDIRVTDDAGVSQMPDIAMVGQDSFFVAWQDNRTGNYQIYLTANLPVAYGAIAGTITEEDGTTPIEGAHIRLIQDGNEINAYTTLTDGNYGFTGIIPGRYDIEVSKFGYVTDTLVDVEVIADQTTTINIELEPTVLGDVSGYVYDGATQDRLGGVLIEFIYNGEVRYSTTTADINGLYELTNVYSYNYQVGYSKTGYITATSEANINPGMNELPDIALFPDNYNVWTILIYMNGDNNLEPYAIDDINEMEMAGSSANATVIVQIDRIPGYDSSNEDWEDTRRYLITSDLDTENINSSRLDSESPLGELNMGNPQTLIDFVNWGIDNYPAHYYALVVWDHGNGWTRQQAYFQDPLFKSMSNDYTDNDSLTIAGGEWSEALAAIKNHLGENIDLIGFDACLMQMWEVAAITSLYGDCMVGSEEVENSDGWGYEQLLNDLYSNPNMNPYEFGYDIVEAAVGGEDQSTLSCVDLSRLNLLNQAMQAFSLQLIHANYNPAYRVDIDEARAELHNSDHEFDLDSHIDLHDFANLVSSNSELPEELLSSADDVINTINEIVYHNRTQPEYDWAKGIAVYYPLNVSDYDSRYDMLLLASATSWDEYIKGFIESDFRPNPDGWSFGNIAENIWPPEWWQQFEGYGYPYEGPFWSIPASSFPDWPLFVDAFGEDQCYFGSNPNLVAVQFWWDIAGGWFGSCFGFSLSAFLFHENHILPDYQGDLFDLGLIDGTRLIINKYQLYQWGQECLKYENEHIQNRATETLMEIGDMFINNEESRFLCLQGYNPGSFAFQGHAVLPWKIEADQGNPELFYIYVYESGAPGIDTFKVRVNSSLDQWWYEPLNLTRRIGLFLSPPSDDFLNHPIIPASWNHGIFPSDNLSTDIYSHSTIFYALNGDYTLSDSSGGQIGNINDSTFTTLADGMHIIPYVPEATRPIGFYIPNETFKLAVNNITDSIFYFDIFSDTVSFFYKRKADSSMNTQKAEFSVSDKYVELLNDNESAETMQLKTFVSMADKFLLFGIDSCGIFQGDTLKFTLVDLSNLSVINKESDKSYNLHLQKTSATQNLIFDYNGIELTPFSEQLISPNWNNTSWDSLAIYIDNGLDGTFDDTLTIANQFINGFKYLPGDANMANGAWPPAVIGGDVTYLVNYFRGMTTNPACMIDGNYMAADVNASCTVIGSDVTRLVSYFRGQAIIEYCPDWEPAWHNTGELPAEAPAGWPGCE